MKTLKERLEELDDFNATLSEDNEDTPETLAEQERLLNAVIAAEAADLTSLSTNQLRDHFSKRAQGQTLAKGLSKAKLIARINALPPLDAPAPMAEPEPTPAADPEPKAFSVSGYAKDHGLDVRELRKQLRAAGLRAPYTVDQVKKAAGE